MPLTKVHTFTAARYLLVHGILSKKDRNTFLLGANFPDIRDILKMERDVTHPPISSANVIGNVNSYFLKGVYFHNLIDNIWFNTFNKAGLLKNSSDEELAMKTLGERFTPVNVVPQLSENEILEIQKLFNIDREVIIKWYKIVSLSLRSTYDLDSSLKMLSFFPNRDKEEVKKYYLKYQDSKELRDMHMKFLKNVNLLAIHI